MFNCASDQVLQHDCYLTQLCYSITVGGAGACKAKTLAFMRHAFISCRLDYCNALLYGIAYCQLQRLQSVQNAAARLVTSLRRTEHITPRILKSLHWLPIRQRVTYKLATLVHKCINGRARGYLAELSSVRRPTSRNEISRQWEAPRTAYADFIW